jgi:hypothetical protein
VESLTDLVEADYRVRKQIKDSLESNYFRNQNQLFATHIAFQLAVCYRIGFGVKSDIHKCHIWLEKSGKQWQDLHMEKEAVRPTSLKNGRIREHNGFIEVNLIQEYRQSGLNKLTDAWNECESEVADMAREFGEFYSIPLALYRIAGNLLDELGNFGKSKAL